MAVFHIDDGEVITGESSDLREGRGEAEEEHTIKGLSISKAGFEGLWGGGGVGGGSGGKTSEGPFDGFGRVV